MSSNYPDTNSILVGGSADIIKGRLIKLGSAADAANAVPFSAAADASIGVALHSARPGQRVAYAYAGCVDVEVIAAAATLGQTLTSNALGQLVPQAAPASQTVVTRAVLREPGVAAVGSRARYTEVSLLALAVPPITA